MSERLQRVIRGKQELDQDRAQLEETRRRQEAERGDKKRAAATLWSKKRADIDAAIEEINTEIRGIGWSLVYGDEQTDVSPAICRDSIRLIEDGQFHDRKIVLNVSAFGKVQAVFLISHSGRGRDFEIAETSKELWIDVITDFLEQVVASKDKRGAQEDGRLGR